MRYFRTRLAYFTLSVVALSATAGSSLAQNCFICDDLVVLNDADAECFLNAYATSRQEAQQKGFVAINLAACNSAADREKRGSIDKPLNDLSVPGEAATSDTTRSSYVFDLAGIDCLHRLVGVQPRPIDPTATFDLLKSCPTR